MRIGVSAAMAVAATVLLGLLTTYTTGEVQRAKDDPGQGFPTIVKDLKASPGCLGVETARTDSGKQVIFAWFEDKKALLKWVQSETHQKLMKQGFPDQDFGKPLRDVADDSGPIMVIASITFADKPKFKESPLPISQIAVEMYQPMKGGAFLGSRFAPAGVKVPGLKDYTPAEKK